MFLVHVRLRPSSPDPPPAGTPQLLLSCARPEERVEHAVVHHVPPDGVIFGLFVAAPDLAAAERIAAVVARRATLTRRELRGLAVLDCASPLLVDFTERQLAGQVGPRPE